MDKLKMNHSNITCCKYLLLNNSQYCFSYYANMKWVGIKKAIIKYIIDLNYYLSGYPQINNIIYKYL